MSFNYLLKNKGCFKFNLGTGKGYSVLDLLKSFIKMNHCDVPYDFTFRREGDVSECYADPNKAFEFLGWRSLRGLDEMSESAWKFLHHNEKD